MTETSDRNRKNLLPSMLAAAQQDKATVSAAGRETRKLLDGVQIRSLTTHVDERGSVTELYDPRWGFTPDPLVFCYTFSIRPQIVKGWSLHKRHQDRYAILQGEMDLVLFDSRAESSTFNEVCVIRMSEYHRCLVNIPEYVWHADYNVGNKDVVALNFPTIQYDHSAPDKWRLPIDTPLIPYRFPSHVRGG